MSRPHRIGSAVSAIVLASMIAGCATPQKPTGFGGKPDENVGLATRALAALSANNLPVAIELAERAVEKSPNDAGFRALLGNAYFAAGRFWSAEAAYKDALTIYSNQPKVILKLALVETALGKKDEAVAFLDAGRAVLDPSDYGLALALAGRGSEAVQVLEAVARQQGADATVRQNLALAHALNGNWTEARTIAAQDVPANQIDARIEQWMRLANPTTPGAQVAALVGVTPAATDAGQPIRLALRKTDTMMAQAAPQPQPQPQPQVAQIALAQAPAPAMQLVQAVAEPAAPEFAAPVASAPPPPPPPPPPAAEPLAWMAAAATELASAAVAWAPKKPSAPVRAAARPAKPQRAMAAAANRPLRRGDTVVQLGAYRSPEHLNAAWGELTKRYPALQAYLPLRARFDSPKGTFWRLSIQGFANQQEAIARCQLLKSRGGSCFVRNFAGDAPVTFASN